MTTKGLSRWITRAAPLRALWLEALSRLTLGRFWATAALVAVIAAAAVAHGSPRATALSSLAQRHLFSVGGFTALVVALLTHWRRVRWGDSYTRGWLATLASSRGALAAALVLRACSQPVLFMLTLAVLSIAATPSVPSSAGDLSRLLCVYLFGTAVGIVAGWYSSKPRPHVHIPTTVMLRTGASTASPLSGLHQWALAQSKIWLKPRSLARITLLGALFPMDMPANIAVAMLGLLIIGVYLVVLLAATIEVARKGADWLRPTPLTFGRYAWAVAKFPLLKEFQWTSFAVILLVALGVKLGIALRLAETWMAIVAVVSSTALTQAYKVRPMRLKVLVTLFAVTTAESIREYLALPTALLLSGWELRKAARS